MAPYTPADIAPLRVESMSAGMQKLPVICALYSMRPIDNEAHLMPSTMPNRTDHIHAHAMLFLLFLSLAQAPKNATCDAPVRVPFPKLNKKAGLGEK